MVTIIYLLIIICLRQVYANTTDLPINGNITDLSINTNTVDLPFNESTIGFLINKEEIVTNLSISPYLDENRYIRLNISWDNFTDKVDRLSIRFLDLDNDKNCNPIDEVDLNLTVTTFVIVPLLSLTHPAEHLENDCKYELILESNYLMQHLQQSIYYKIPDCVQDKCKCEDKRNSPYQISSITPVHDDVYYLKWNKTSNITLKIVDVTYNKENSSSQTHIKDQNVTEDGVEILLDDLKEEINYRITVLFMHDGCYFVSRFTFFLPPETEIVPVERKTLSVVVGLVFFTVSMAALFFIATRFSRKFRSQFKKHVSCWSYQTSEDVISRTPLSSGVLKEEAVNTTYTPLEFLMRSGNYDKYEFPRNKVIIGTELGRGAFGIVYSGEAFELGNAGGYTKVAIKQLRMDATEEEKQDLLKEINILKEVGEHANIVRLLGCVTMDQPYLMLLELVPCGSLKSYLMKLRKKWSDRRSRFFFADDMFEAIQASNINRQKSENLKYTTCVFENSDNSYIQPHELPIRASNCKSHNNDGTIAKYLTLDRTNSSSFQVPHSPVSFASIDLPSSTGTEITLLSSEPSSPMSNDYTSKIQAVLDNSELQRFALQIARGMQHLEGIKIAHRDLAARNILMANDKVLKISDFGLSRVGTYVSSGAKVLPLRWMAIEAIESKICDNKSDVWSYGVVLWEIGTLGAFPYQKTPNSLILHDLKIGKRLERPRICTNELYDLMLHCWEKNPDDRPKFCEIVDQLEVEHKKAYVDFSVLNPTYVFPPATEECT